MPSGRELVAAAIAVALVMAAAAVLPPDRADAGAGPTTGVVFIATGENFPDALGAGPAAALGLGPILLVNKNSVPPATLNELNRLTPAQIFIVGGTAVITDGVKTTLEGLSFGPTVTRLAGANRYETAAAVSAATFPAPHVVAAHAGGNQVELVLAADVVVRSVTLTAPSAGVVVVNSTASAYQPTSSYHVFCSITTGTTMDYSFQQLWQSPGSPGPSAQLAGTRGFNVAAGPFTANLVCNQAGPDGYLAISDSALTAIFIPGS
jgi:hypothetical protein